MFQITTLFETPFPVASCRSKNCDRETPKSRRTMKPKGVSNLQFLHRSFVPMQIREFHFCPSLVSHWSFWANAQLHNVGSSLCMKTDGENLGTDSVFSQLGKAVSNVGRLDLRAQSHVGNSHGAALSMRVCEAAFVR